MKRPGLALMLVPLLVPVPAVAQGLDNLPNASAVEKLAVVSARGALLRGLDKVTGRTSDLPMATGETLAFGRLNILLGQCRQPKGDPESDAFAELTITDRDSGGVEFAGWMIASSPALSALDDARYDVWVVACNDGSKSVARPAIEYVPEPDAPVEGGEGQAVPGTAAAPAPDDVQGADTGDDPVLPRTSAGTN